jgi:hypothetical protein
VAPGLGDPVLGTTVNRCATAAGPKNALGEQGKYGIMTGWM